MSYGRVEEKPRRVVAAALKHTSGLVLVGVRHCDQFMRAQMDAAGIKDMHGEQGFVDNRYQFLSREEAGALAVEAGQLDLSKGFPVDKPYLFSEDVW